MSAATVAKTKPASANPPPASQEWFSPLNLHWAGVGLLVLLNVYLLAHMALLWHAQADSSPDAIAKQRIALKAAQIAASPLRGLDQKVDLATEQADRFYRDRLPLSDSAMLAELGTLTRASGVRLAGVQYEYSPVLTGTPGALTELRIDARLSGDYRPLMQFINSLERDKMFFVIDGVTLTGQQSGTVNLRLRLRTYLRGASAQAAAAQSNASAPATGGAQ